MPTMVFPLPIRGLHRGYTVDKLEGAFTDSICNVMPTDAGEGRLRLSKRPGLSKWADEQIGSSEVPITCIAVVSVNT